jgi:hypothetical protein
MPDWWSWPFILLPHFEWRMEDRGLSEVELRLMLARARAIVPARRPGRWIVTSRLHGRPWTVVVEPDPMDEITYVVTAFPRD